MNEGIYTRDKGRSKPKKETDNTTKKRQSEGTEKQKSLFQLILLLGQ